MREREVILAGLVKKQGRKEIVEEKKRKKNKNKNKAFSCASLQIYTEMRANTANGGDTCCI